jgi:hypothetical protein
MRAVAKKSSSLLLLAVLVVFVILQALPRDVAQIRLGPLSLLWWWGGVLGPLIAVLAALVPARARDEPRAG